MGTVFTIDIRTAGEWSEPLGQVVAWLHHIDAVFSTYKPDSDICRINRRELRVPDADPLVAEVLGLCADVQQETGGYFNVRRATAIDPTGLVKGWAIERASDLLRAAGATSHTVNGGGDMQIAGEIAPGEPWPIGIADPQDPATIISVVTCRDIAIATSGTTERGNHIHNPFTGTTTTSDLLSVSVIGPRLTRVDAYATAAFAMGRDALRWLDTLPGYEGLGVDCDGDAFSTRSWPPKRAEPSRQLTVLAAPISTHYRRQLAETLRAAP
jgi:thiamine biosynthesis lipoprotein